MPTTPTGLFYDVRSAPFAGAPAVILSAGLGGAAAFWAPQMAVLSAAFQVVTYDHRGTGRSVRQLTQPHSVDAMAADIVEVLDAAGIARAHLVGHAAGGLAGLALALAAPARLDRLVVVNGWAAPDPHIARCFEARLGLLDHSGPRAYVRAQPLFLYPPDWISQNTPALDAEEPHHIAGFPAPQVMRDRIAALLAFDIVGRLADIAAPTLVYASADDMLVPPRCSQRLADGLPYGRSQVAPWGGHAFTVTAAEAFNAAVTAFLTAEDLTSRR